MGSKALEGQKVGFRTRQGQSDPVATHDQQLMAWARENFSEGCLLGDLARTSQKELSEDEMAMLSCAREGWLAAGGR